MGCPFVFIMLNFIVLTEMMRQNMRNTTACFLPNPYTVATLIVFIRNLVVLISNKKFYLLPHIWNLGVLTTIAYLIDLTRWTLVKCKTSDFLTSALTAIFIVAISLRNPFEELYNTLDDTKLYSTNYRPNNSDTSSARSNVRRRVRVLKAISNKFEESSSDISKACNNCMSTQTSKQCVSKCCQCSNNHLPVPKAPLPKRPRGDDGDCREVKKEKRQEKVEVQRAELEQAGDFEARPQLTTKCVFVVPRKERTSSSTRGPKKDIIHMEDLINSTEVIAPNAAEPILAKDRGLFELANLPLELS